MLTLSLAQIDVHIPSFAHLLRGVRRSMQVMHGFVMLELAGFFGEVNDPAMAVGPVLGPTSE